MAGIVAAAPRVTKRVRRDAMVLHEDDLRPLHKNQEQLHASGSRKDSQQIKPDIEFNDDSIRHWKSLEMPLQPLPGIIWKLQDDITCGMRQILIDWLSEVCDHLKLTREVLFLTVNYIDRFLTRIRVPQSEFQLLGIACAWVASKYEAVHPPSGRRLIHLTNNSYTLRQLHSMETMVLQALEFNLGSPTALKFCDYILQQTQLVHSSVTLLAEHLLDVSILTYPSGCAPKTQLSSAVPIQGSHPVQSIPTLAGSVDSHDACHAEDSVLPRSSSCSSNGSELSFPEAVFQSMSEMDDEDAYATASGRANLNPPNLNRPAMSVQSRSDIEAVMATAVATAAMLEATGRPAGEHNADLICLTTALPSHIAAGAVFASAHAHQLQSTPQLIKVLAALAECDEETVWRLSKALTELKNALSSAPKPCAVVKRYRNKKMFLQAQQLQPQVTQW